MLFDIYALVHTKRQGDILVMEGHKVQEYYELVLMRALELDMSADYD
jgi:hypothetical protein